MPRKKSHVNNQIEMNVKLSNKKIQIKPKPKPKRITKRNCKQDLLMQSLITFFSNKKNIDIILSIIEGKSKISLRLIDWFVTNYCKKNTVRYYINKKGLPKKQIDVHLNYKTQLKSFSKKQFDPFRRDERILFEYNNEKKLTLTTTVGQLNFFRWVIKNNILTYIEKNLKSIEKDMNSVTKKNRIKYLKDKDKDKDKDKNKEQKTTKNKKPIRKRRQLCVSATKTISKHIATITVNFN
jgi:hypothetical protein